MSGLSKHGGERSADHPAQHATLALVCAGFGWLKLVRFIKLNL